MTMMMTTTRTLIRPPDVSQEGLRFYPKTLFIYLFIYFLSIHRAQQPRSGRPSNVFRRFGRR